MTGRGFPDHFSGTASTYAAFRPGYPPELFEFLAASCSRREVAWDCASGSGQAAAELSAHFGLVIATDASVRQLAAAIEGDFHRLACLAERSALRGKAADLITVAQALHWFRREEFYSEVRRVARPGAIFAAWTYGAPLITSELDALLRIFDEEWIGPYWPLERAQINARYARIEFPFDEMPAPDFEFARTMTGTAFLGFLGTWSAVRNARAALCQDPIERLAPRWEARWGPLDTEREVRWPIAARVVRVSE